MTSELCRNIQCEYFYKFCGKAACQFQRPKRFVRHLQQCPIIPFSKIDELGAGMYKGENVTQAERHAIKTEK